jgi:hypothetical protein
MNGIANNAARQDSIGFRIMPQHSVRYVAAPVAMPPRRRGAEPPIRFPRLASDCSHLLKWRLWGQLVSLAFHSQAQRAQVSSLFLSLAPLALNKFACNPIGANMSVFCFFSLYFHF